VSDERIIEYLRSRANVEVPIGLTDQVMGAVRAMPARRSWGASLLPAVAAVAGVAVLVVVGLLVTRPPNVGPPATPSAAPSSPSVSPSPSPTAPPQSATPSPSPAPTSSPPPGYVSVDGLPITVLENEAADALFSDVQTCVSEAGYTLTFPASWYTNVPVGDALACSWFGPDPFDASNSPTSGNPDPGDGVWISMGVTDGVVGYTSITPIYMSDDLRVGGYDGRRVEFGPSTLEEVESRPDYRAYHYVIPFEEFGPTFSGGTNVDLAEDYMLAKAVLDRIMATIVFDRSMGT
jgi:hypothetical protein